MSLFTDEEKAQLLCLRLRAKGTTEARIQEEVDKIRAREQEQRVIEMQRARWIVERAYYGDSYCEPDHDDHS